MLKTVKGLSIIKQFKQLLTFDECNAHMGLLSGKDTVPVDKMAVAGLATFNVAPNGNRYVKALKAKK